MSYQVSEWLNLIIRWVHVFAGILWIGQTYYFTWLDGRLTAHAEKNIDDGRVWMVHSGGFYSVEKQKVPQAMPEQLYWFRWEAALTWISGLLLLILVYYMGGIMVDPVEAKISKSAAIGIGIGLLFLGWIIYDLLWLSPLARNEAVLATICFLLLVALAFALTRVFSGRAAYMHVGALLGTLMAANVWERILPAQRALIAATREGREPNLELAIRAKNRSKHNTFMVIPVVFIMLSNHFPTATYGHKANWLVLAGLILAGGVAAKIVRSH